MATIKSRKITKIVREFVKQDASYDITGVDLGLAKYLWRVSQDTFQDLAAGDYRIDQSNGKQTLVILNAELLAQAEAFQVGYVLDFTASEYDTEWNVDINQLKEKYNTLVQNTQSLWEYVRLTGFIADDTTINLILPQLDDNQFWFYQDGKYKAYDVSDFRQLGESLIEAYAEYQKSVIELMVRNARENIQNNVNNGAVSIQNLLNTLNLNVENFTGDKKLELQKIINDFRKELEVVSVGNANTVQGYIPTNFERVENTIKDLTNAKKYKEGEVVEVLGYYTAGDGAGHKRKIEETDNGSGVQLSNGLWANIVHNGEVNVSWFGAKGDGVSDDTEAFKKSIKVGGVAKISVPKGVFCIYDTLDIGVKTISGYSKHHSHIKKMTTEPMFNMHNRIKLTDMTLSFDENVYTNANNYECIVLKSNNTKKEGWYYPQFSWFENIVVNGCTNGIYVSSDSGFFSNTLKNIEVRNYTYTAIEFLNNTRTQNTYDNLYISSKYLVKNSIIFSGEETGSTINGLNLEHTRHTGNSIVFSGFHSYISNIHIEGLVLTTKLSSFISIEKSKINITNLDLYYSFLDTDTSSVWDYSLVKITDRDITDKNNILTNFVVENLNIVGLNYQYQLGRLLGLNDPNLRWYFLWREVESNKKPKVTLKNFTYKTWIDDNIKLERFDCDPHRKIIKRLEFLPRFLDIPFNGVWGSSQNDNLRIRHNLFLQDEPPKASINQIIDKFNTSDVTLANVPTSLSGYSISRSLRDDCNPVNTVDFRLAYGQLRLLNLNISDDSGEVVPNYKRIYLNLEWEFTRDIGYTCMDLNTSKFKGEMQQEGVYEDFIQYMDEKTEYDRLQRELEQQRQFAFEQSGMENYEEWLAEQPMMLPAKEEPQPSDKLLAFKTKYLG